MISPPSICPANTTLSPSPSAMPRTPAEILALRGNVVLVRVQAHALFGDEKERRRGFGVVRFDADDLVAVVHLRRLEAYFWMAYSFQSVFLTYPMRV